MGSKEAAAPSHGRAFGSLRRPSRCLPSRGQGVGLRVAVGRVSGRLGHARVGGDERRGPPPPAANSWAIGGYCRPHYRKPSENTLNGLYYTLDVDHIAAESRIRLYLSLEYPAFSPEQVSRIVNMNGNFHAMLPSLNRQKQDRPFDQWNAYRISHGMSSPGPKLPSVHARARTCHLESGGFDGKAATSLVSRA